MTSVPTISDATSIPRPLSRARRLWWERGSARGCRCPVANTVDVLAAGQRVTLLVVAPEASAKTAHAVLLAAGRRGNTDDVDRLLQLVNVPGSADSQLEAALQRWELDGGRMTRPFNNN